MVKVNVVNKQSVVLINNFLDEWNGDYYLVRKGCCSGMDPGANKIVYRGQRTYVALTMTMVLPLLSCLCPVAIT